MINPDDPAYPHLHNTCQRVNETEMFPGLTIRAYIAAKADIPWNAVIDALEKKGEPKPTVARVLEYRAAIKVLEADALIAELNKQP